MDIKDLKGLMEAYSEVYAPQEVYEAVYGGTPKKKEEPKDDRLVVTRADKKANTKAYQNYKAGNKAYKAADHLGEEVVEEGLRSAVKRLLGGGKKEAEAPKPESRGAELRRRYNVGPEKSDTSAKRQILDRSRARAEKNKKDYGDKPFQKQVANQSKAAHDRYLKAGYSKYGADDARGSGNKARKRAAALNIEELEFIVNALIEEGYDLSSYTWDEMYEVCLDEAVKGLNEEEYDTFNVVLEYLIAEGYADTEEAALAIMANMSEEWREGIIEGMFDFLPKSTTVIPGKYGKNTVLSKKGGVEGVSDKSKPGSFTPQRGGFDKMDAERYATQHSTQGTSSGTSGINLAGRRETSGRVK